MLNRFDSRRLQGSMNPSIFLGKAVDVIITSCRWELESFGRKCVLHESDFGLPAIETIDYSTQSKVGDET